MRKMRAVGVMSFILLFANLYGLAQKAAESIPSRQLEIAFSKTTHLVFPFAIKSVDRGSKDILAQKAGGIENVLQLKAARESFQETNLTVITSDGKLYSFLVNYSQDPQVLNFSFHKENECLPENEIQFAFQKINAADMEFNTGLVAGAKKRTPFKKDEKFGVSLTLDGVFVKDEVLYFRLALENNTHIWYDIDQLRFFIRDQKKARRTATQEMEVKPVYVLGPTDRISGKTQQSVVFALPKFTIPDKKYLAIQLMEKNGGRHLSLKVLNKLIVRAEPINAI